MLVLSRKAQEQIHIGDNIRISILKIHGNTVRVGIEAPREVRVLRGELPMFESMEEPTTTCTDEAAPAESGGESATVTDVQWVVMRRLANRRPCLPVRRCLASRKSKSPESMVAQSMVEQSMVEQAVAVAK